MQDAHRTQDHRRIGGTDRHRWVGYPCQTAAIRVAEVEQSRDWFSEASRRSSGACGAVCQDGRRWLDPGRRKRADPGRAHLTLNGIAVKGRFKFHHQAGSAYHHEIQLTWFGLPLVTVVEQYKDGQANMSLPGTRIENDEKTNLAANQGLWAEAPWLPSIWFTDGRVEWVAIDDTTAKLVIPDAVEEEQFTTTFDADAGLIKDLTTLRYGESDDPARHRWTNTAIEWGEMNGIGFRS
jgi:hypothetical protein